MKVLNSSNPYYWIQILSYINFNTVGSNSKILKPLTFKQVHQQQNKIMKHIRSLSQQTKKRRRMMKKKIKLIYLWNDTEAITECHLHTSLSINSKKLYCNTTYAAHVLFWGCQYVSSCIIISWCDLGISRRLFKNCFVYF